MVLDTSDSVSLLFQGNGGVSWLFCAEHNGGSWSMQARKPDGSGWVALDDLSITKEDVIRWHSINGVTFRFSGGTVGARIYVSGVEVVNE